MMLPRVLWVSESPRLHTGYGRVANEITRRLAASGRYELGVVGWSVEGSADRPADYTVFSAGSAPWSSARINWVIEDFAPDVVVTSGPLFILSAMSDVPLRPFVSWVGYAFFEASPVPPQWQATIRKMDHAVVASSWCRFALAAGNRGQRRFVPRVIPLGVDARVFHPRADREALRAARGLGDRFVIGCVAQNEFRKQLPVLVKAFAVFARRHREAFLYLHTDPDGPAWRLLDLVQRHRIADQVAFTRGLAGPIGIGDHSLNALYNIFDVMVLPTMGEAFGLPILEAMAAGVPVAATHCSAVPELVEGRGELVAVRDWLTMSWDNAEYALADADDLAARLERVYSDPALRANYAAEGRAFAETLTWERTAGAWIRLLDGAISARARKATKGWLPWVEALHRNAPVGPVSEEPEPAARGDVARRTGSQEAAPAVNGERM